MKDVRKKIFVYGDSISMQYGFPLKEILEKRNCGYERKGGSNSTDLANPVWNGLSSHEMLDWVQQQPRRDMALLFNCGLHDIVRGGPQKPCRTDAGTYEKNLIQICGEAKKRFSQIVFANTTPVEDSGFDMPRGWMRFNRDVILYNRIAESVMAACGVSVIDLYTYTAALKKEFAVYRDSVHMTGRASGLQAERIVNQLAEWGIVDG
ncbi:MAG TPA: hypothetical protein DF613_01100 [Lachnospiraceae bacterium]|nr:hypothetical protein [Lachnospiraceae bacterium]